MSLLLLLNLASPAHAQTTDCDHPAGGAIMISADSSTVTSSKTIQLVEGQNAFACTLYVLANLEGAIMNGLRGAEFGIETTNPDFLYFEFWRTGTVIGSAVAPSPGGGVQLGWSSCQDDPSLVILGELIVLSFDTQPVVTKLRVRRFQPLADPNRLCAATNVCDPPDFTWAPAPPIGIDANDEPIYSRFTLLCCGSVAVDDHTWASVKSLYR